MKLDLTLPELKNMIPCEARFKAMRPLFGVTGTKRVTLRQAAKCGASMSDILWVAGKLAATDNRMLGIIVQFSLDCALAVHTQSPRPDYMTQTVAAVSVVVSALMSDRKPNKDEADAAWSAWSAARSAAESARSAAESESAAESAQLQTLINLFYHHSGTSEPQRKVPHDTVS